MNAEHGKEGLLIMEEKFQYRIGLDIGIASVGWAVLENNCKDEPVHIMDLGVRIFDTACGV
jgi:CRISPR-associated endonuclease Csn1